MDRPELLAFFEKREIETRRIPLKVLERARKVVERIEGGQPIWKLRGNECTMTAAGSPSRSVAVGGCWPLTWTA